MLRPSVIMTWGLVSDNCSAGLSASSLVCTFIKKKISPHNFIIALCARDGFALGLHYVHTKVVNIIKCV